jgi:MFS family permease
MSFCRIFAGIFQVALIIYFPVWVDQNGPEDKRTLWLTFLQLGVPLGIVLGYIMTGIFVSYLHWWWAFWAQSVMLGILFVAFLCFPSKYYVERSKLDEKRLKRQIERK